MKKKWVKKLNKDASRGKSTLISFFGKENAKKKSNDLINNSKKILRPYGNKQKEL